MILSADRFQYRRDFSACRILISDRRCGNLSGLVHETTVESVLEGFAALRAKFDRLDIMVNCAGILGPNAFALKTAEVKAEDFDQVYQGMENICINQPHPSGYGTGVTVSQ